MNTELDTIYIELAVTAVHMDKVWMHGSIEIRIGDSKPYNESDVVITDVLLESLESDGEYFIFSCCCGMPSCSGWIKGIQVTHQKDTVRWVDPNNNKSWTFDKNQMLKDIETIREEVKVFKRFFKEKEIDYVGVGYNW